MYFKILLPSIILLRIHPKHEYTSVNMTIILCLKKSPTRDRLEFPPKRTPQRIRSFVLSRTFLHGYIMIVYRLHLSLADNTVTHFRCKRILHYYVLIWLYLRSNCSLSIVISNGITRRKSWGDDNFFYTEKNFKNIPGTLEPALANFWTSCTMFIYRFSRTISSSSIANCWRHNNVFWVFIHMFVLWAI